MEEDKIMRQHLIYFLKGRLAHPTFEKAVADLPFKYRGMKTGAIPYSIWQLVEHLRIAQWDIVEFSRNPGHISPDWPEGYWTKDLAPQNEQNWTQSLKAVKTDQENMIDLISNPDNDLIKPFPHGDGQNLMREAMLIVDHNAYHIGQIILIRKLLGIW